MVTEGCGVWCAFTNATISLYETSVGFWGAGLTCTSRAHSLSAALPTFVQLQWCHSQQSRVPVTKCTCPTTLQSGGTRLFCHASTSHFAHHQIQRSCTFRLPGNLEDLRRLTSYVVNTLYNYIEKHLECTKQIMQPQKCNHIHTSQNTTLWNTGFMCN